METPKVKVGYIGTTPTRWTHGNLSLEFQPGEIKEVEANVAELLLIFTVPQREFSKNKVVSQKRVCLFAEVTSEEIPLLPTDKPEKKKKGKKQVQTETPVIPVVSVEQTETSEGTDDAKNAENSTQGEA